MITINEYLDLIAFDFNNYLNSGVKLCDLKKLHFDAGKVPRYEDPHVQQLYLLRYAYAYAFEYKTMYLHLLSKVDVGDNITVLSIGCGNMADYWALTQVIPETTVINYKGFDVVDWAYKFPKRNQDWRQIVLGNAVDAFEELERIDADVIVFPKSISEFSVEDIERFCESIKSKQIVKEKVNLLVSLRLDEHSRARDLAKAKKLYDAFLCAGYKTSSNCYEYTGFVYEDKKIRELDDTFSHPAKAVELLKDLHQRCVNYKDGQTCESDCRDRLSRWPMLKCKALQWQLLQFYRGE